MIIKKNSICKINQDAKLLHENNLHCEKKKMYDLDGLKLFIGGKIMVGLCVNKAKLTHNPFSLSLFFFLFNL